MEGHHAAESVGDEMRAKEERKVGRRGDAAKTVVECDGSAVQQVENLACRMRWKTRDAPMRRGCHEDLWRACLPQAVIESHFYPMTRTYTLMNVGFVEAIPSALFRGNSVYCGAP